MSLELSADDWIQDPAFQKQKISFKPYECMSCGSEFSSPKVSTEEANLILKGVRNPRETLLILALCLLISEYSFMLASSIAFSIFILKDIQRTLVVSRNIKRGRCPHCLGHNFKLIQ